MTLAAFPGTATIAASGSAVSHESHSILDRMRNVQRWIERSVSLYGAKSEAISGVWDLFDMLSEPDWDGYGGEPISEMAAVLSEQLIRSMPEGLPLPDIAGEPDGSISLTWYGGKYRTLVISAGSRGRLAYAWLDGTNTGRGVVRLDRGRLPNIIHELIKSTVIA